MNPITTSAIIEFADCKVSNPQLLTFFLVAVIIAIISWILSIVWYRKYLKLKSNKLKEANKHDRTKRT